MSTVHTWDCTAFLLRNNVSRNSVASQAFSWEQLFWTSFWHQLFSCCYQAGKPQFLHVFHTDMLKIHFKLYKRIPSKTIRTWATHKTTCDLPKEPGDFFQLMLELSLSELCVSFCAGWRNSPGTPMRAAQQQGRLQLRAELPLLGIPHTGTSLSSPWPTATEPRLGWTGP